MPMTSKLANLFGLPAHHIAVLQGGLEAVHVPGIDSIRSISIKSARNVVILSVSAFTGAIKITQAAHRHFDQLDSLLRTEHMACTCYHCKTSTGLMY